jgi:hypothetical protein
VYIGPAVKRVEFVSDKMPDIILTDQPRDFTHIARNSSDPTNDKNYESNDCFIWHWSRYSIHFLSRGLPLERVTLTEILRKYNERAWAVFM